MSIMQKLGLPAHGHIEVTVPELEKFLKTHDIHGVTSAMLDKRGPLNLHLDVN